MKKGFCRFTSKRVGCLFAVLIASGLEVSLSLPAQANSTGSASGNVAAPAPHPHQTLPHLESQLAIATPNLPSLGDPDPFLPIVHNIRLEIRLSERRVYIYDQDQVIKSYPVAVGRAGWETPVGNYEVIQMAHDPVWQHPFTGEVVPPGPDNPLGSRWIGFWTDGTNFIGFHGTPNVESVGQAASHGCIRMYDQDVVALFDQVEMGTPVSVVP